MKNFFGHYLITATLKNGDKWETIRHTKAGMQLVIENVLWDADVVSFTVEGGNE